MDRERAWCLERIDDGGFPVRQYRIPRLPCDIGRAPECGIRLEMKQISRRHARLVEQGGRVVLEDLGSTNGTFVNTQRLAAPTVVRPGDAIHFAEYEFRLVQHTAGPVEEPAGDARNAVGDSGTIVGYMGGPEGFPLLTPAFFELLNGRQFRCLRRPIIGNRGEVFGYELTARSTHPKLKRSIDELFEFADELDEGRTLTECLREALVEAAEKAQTREPVLLPACLATREDAEPWLRALSGLDKRFPALELICEIVWQGAPDATQRLQGLTDAGLTACLRVDDPSSLRAEHLPQSAAFVRVTIDEGHAVDAAWIRSCRGRGLRVIADGIHSEDMKAWAKQAGIGLMMGAAVGEFESLSCQP